MVGTAMRGGDLNAAILFGDESERRGTHVDNARDAATLRQSEETLSGSEEVRPRRAVGEATVPRRPWDSRWPRP